MRELDVDPILGPHAEVLQLMATMSLAGRGPKYPGVAGGHGHPLRYEADKPNVYHVGYPEYLDLDPWAICHFRNARQSVDSTVTKFHRLLAGTTKQRSLFACA